MKKLETLLLVDDDPDIQFITKMALVAGGLKVDVCSSGEETLRKAHLASWDLILLDVMMPGMDGIMTLKELRKIPQQAGTAVVFLTAKAQRQEIEDYKKIKGVIDVIAKPFDPMTLADKVRSIWDNYFAKSRGGKTIALHPEGG